MYVKYDKYKVFFKDSGLDYNGCPKEADREYLPITPGYVSIDEGRNVEDYKEGILEFYKHIFYGEAISGIEKFEPLSRKEIKDLREKYKCGFKLFYFGKDDNERKK